MNAETETPDLTEEERFAAFAEQGETETPVTVKPDAPTETKPVSEAPAKLDPLPVEPFPGYNALSEDGRKAVDAAFAERRTLTEKAEKLGQQYRQQQGQLSPMQRKAADLERQNMALLNRLKEVDKATQERTNAAGSEAMARYKELYPDEAAAMEAIANPLQAKIAELEERLGTVGKQAEYAERTQRETVQMQRESSVVLKEHPDASEVINDPAFHVWVDALDEDDRQMVASKDSRQAIKVLNNFKRDKAYVELLAAQQGSPKTPVTPANRKPRLDVEPNPRNRQSPAPRGTGNAYGSAEEEAWANFADDYEARTKSA
jgi:hypothetical protein